MNYGLYVVRKNENEVRVFSDICTGHFDIMGKNISGPPPRPLDEFVTKIEDGNLYVQLPAFKRTS